MKTYIILFALLITSCHPYRSTLLKTTQHSQQQYHHRQLYQFGDSLSRQWYFYTDSPFVYHPDSTLIANSGYIWFEGYRTRSTLQQMEQDGTLFAKSTSLDRQKERNWTGYFSVVLGAIGLLITIGCIVRLRKGKDLG